MFLVFEGIDGAGKTTQTKLLQKWLQKQGSQVLVTREPGGTNVGKQIRKIVLESETVHPRTEALLYAADRAQHVQETILPALDKQTIVISDRYVDSSIAYQSAGRKINETEIKNLSTWATNDLKPNLTIILDLSVEEAKKRWLLRGEKLDRIENEQTIFHEFVKKKFLTLAEKNPKQYFIVDASQPEENVAKQIQQKVADLLETLQSGK